MKSYRITMAILAALAAWLAVAGCSSGGASAEASDGPGDIAALPAGKAVDLVASAAPGKVTIFDFYADWCQPCRIVAPQLEELAHQNPERIALRKVNVINWDSEAVAHQQIDYLPYLAVVTSDGSIAAQGDTALDYVKDKFGLDLMASLLIM